jgi:hypothetical protein
MTHDTHRVRDFGMGIYTSLKNVIDSLVPQGFQEKYIGPGGERRMVHSDIPGLVLDISEDRRLGLCYVTAMHYTCEGSRRAMEKIIIG